MENNLSNTSKCLVDGDRPFGLAIGDRAQVIQHIGAVYHIHPVAEGGARIAASLKPRLDDLLERHTLFGGREVELKRLNEFLAQRPSGYQFITGQSGFGKTALLVNWVKALQQGGQSLCYHFISRLDEVADEEFALRNLCQQLVVYQGLSGALPASTPEIRALYRQLLVIPPVEGEKLVVVLDGLDEARGWIPGADLFPHPLPEGVFVAFSAREEAERDWPAMLGLSGGIVDLIPLETMGAKEIANLLQKAGGRAASLASRTEFVKAMHIVSGGDPFYLHFLVKDVRRGDITIDNINDQPQGLDAYLTKWWEQLADDVEINRQEAYDLLSILAVAKGRLSPVELAGLSPNLAKGALLKKELSGKLRRYLIGDRQSGYALCHPRFGEYLNRDVFNKEEVQNYRAQLLSYCARWQEHKSEYALAHYAAHLDDAGRYQDLLNLLAAEWTQAKWNAFGSYSALIQDLNIALTAAQKQEPPDFANATALVVARQTARELMLDFPTPLVVAWVKLGEIRRVLRLLDAIDGARAVEPLTAVAEVLTTMGKIQESSEDRIDHAQIAADLLGRALAVLPMLPSSGEQLTGLATVTALLGANTVLAEAPRQLLLEQAQALAQSLSEPALRVANLGLVAEAMATSASGQAQARPLVEQACRTLDRIDSPPDRLVATAYLLPALRKIQPSATLSTLRSALREVTDPGESSLLDSAPLRTLLQKWVRVETHEKEEAATLLREIWSSCVNRAKPLSYIAGHAVGPLHELGQGETAIELIQDLWQRSVYEGTWAIFGAMPALYTLDAKRTAAWLYRALQPTLQQLPIWKQETYHTIREHCRALGSWYGLADAGSDSGETVVTQRSSKSDWAHEESALFLSRLAHGLASIGNQDLAIKLLEATKAYAISPAVDILCDSLRLPMKPGELRFLMDGLVKLVGTDDSDEPAEEGQKRAKVMSVAAQVLAAVDPAAARRYADRAAQLCWSGLPAGNTDVLRRFQAVALHDDGDYSGACAAADAMKWPVNTVAAYTELIEDSAAVEEAQVLVGYAEGMLRALRSVVLTTSDIAELEKTSPEEARALTELWEQRRNRLVNAARDAESSVSGEGAELIAAAPAVRVLNERLPSAARTMCDYINKGLSGGALSIFAISTTLFQCLAAEASARTRFDRAEGLAHFDKALELAGNFLDKHLSIIPAAWAAIYQYLSEILAIAPAEVLARLKQAHHIGKRLGDFGQTPVQSIFLESTYAAALAPVDSEQAISILREQLGSITALGEIPPPDELQDLRVGSERIGEIRGPRFLQALVAKYIGEGVTKVAEHRPDEAAEMMRELLAAIAAITSQRDKAQALADLFKSGAKAPSGFQPAVSEIFKAAIEQANAIPDSHLSTHALTQAIAALCQLGKVEEAERIFLDSTEGSDLAEGTIKNTKLRIELDELSPLERVFAQDFDPGYHIIYEVRSGNAEPVLGELIRICTGDRTPRNRYDLINHWVRAMMVPSKAVGGTALMTSIIHAIEDFDQRLFQPTSLVAQ